MQKKDIYRSVFNNMNKLVLLCLFIIILTVSNCGKKADPLRPIEADKNMIEK
tara:strand:- start:342 stop:497 length:156 start_codon:yes stop_codon:yes gene_type:complete